MMIATVAEANPSWFPHTPLVDVHRTLIPSYLRVVSKARRTPTKTAGLTIPTVEVPR